MSVDSLKSLGVRSDSVGLEELELWPDAIWRLAALLRAGCSPAQACTHVAAYLVGLEREERTEQRSGLLAVVGKLRPSARQQQGLEGAQAQMAQLFETASAQAQKGLPLAGVYLKAAGQAELRESVRQGAARVAACWQVGERTGASLAQVFERLARYLETDIDLRQQRETALSGPRATGRILSWLPFVGLGLGILMGTDPLGVLLGSVPGALVGCLGLALAWCGNRWTARLIHRAEEGQ